MLLTIEITFFLNFSFVFQRLITAATTTAIIAIIAMIGPLSAVKALEISPV